MKKILVDLEVKINPPNNKVKIDNCDRGDKGNENNSVEPHQDMYKAENH